MGSDLLKSLINRPPAELAALRLSLGGESVIDWPRLEFDNLAAVDAFIKLQEFDTSRPADRRHMTRLYHDATSYLTDLLGYHIPDEIKDLRDVRQLFMFASQHEGKKRNRVYACMTLKVMHILHHLLARELLFNAPVSEAQLANMLSKKVYDAIDGMRASGIAVVEYAGGRKTRHSLITKLLAKRETIASQIFDKTRFRIVVKRPADVLEAMAFMQKHIFPFNYVIPGQSENALIDLHTVAQEPESAPIKRFIVRSHHGSPQTANEFSGKSYRSINFVADVPLRIGEALKQASPLIEPELFEIVFVLAEFQLLDEQTAEQNEQGDNSHNKYKARQLVRVRQRLEAGAKKPNKKSAPAPS